MPNPTRSHGRSLAVIAGALALATSLTIAGIARAGGGDPPDPAPKVQVTETTAGARITLIGDWTDRWYTVWRGPAVSGSYEPVIGQQTLCTGECFAIDPVARAGRTYWYRFDLTTPEGAPVSYGPFQVTIPDRPLAVRLLPNPGAGATRIELSVPGSLRDAPVRVQARLFDVQGRLVRTLHDGPVARGVTTVAWDGRGDDGRALGAGVYLVRVHSPLGTTVTRALRVH